MTPTYRVEKICQGDTIFEVLAHPSLRARRVIINMPGYRGDINGYNNKYRALGSYLATRGVAAFIQMPNISERRREYARELVADFTATIERVFSIAPEICATKTPEICLVGFSAGGFAAAAAAPRNGEVKKLLLMEPTVNVELMGGFPLNLGAFKGEVYIVVGDQGVGARAGRRYYDAFTGASRRALVVVPNCDHQFRGTRNGQIMSKAYLWACAGDATFPSPEGGLKLY